MEARKRYVLITGCGQGGIGEALVKEYAKHGVEPIATLLPGEPYGHLDQAGIMHFPLDVTKEASVIELKKSVHAVTNGFLDILINNAGIAYTMTAIDTDVSAVQAMFNVNVFGPMRMVHHFHDLLIASSGMIVNIGSIGGIVPYVYGASYNASKAALQHWSNTLRIEMAPLDVKVLTIISGEIGTNILKNDYQRELPEGSYYSPLANEFKQHVQRTPNTTDRFAYAKRVVQKSLSLHPPAWFWCGKATFIVRLLDTVGWRTIWDSIFSRMFSLEKVRRFKTQSIETRN
ncbi:NAD(P)-binding protein [Xylaria sp. FL1777]|nr:NAD(P)-binding protein [Xylaria sp. FL1777]